MDELGRGAFSIVYSAKHHQTNEMVAIKIIQFSSFTESERHRQERILDNEIRIMQKIMEECEDTTNLIHFRDVIREPNRLAIVMEVLQGKELFDRIVQRQRYTEHDAAFLMNKIMRAIRTLHRRNILHRDLKPENLVFASEADDAEVKITDFGLAMVMDWEDVHQTVVGTPNYVAPEVVSINPRRPLYGPACDVWSMGVILYILLVGYPPFYHDNVRELFKQIRRGAYEFHKEQWENISKEAIDLVEKMLVVDPKKRLTVDQVLEHPWMRNAPNSELPSSTISKMKKLTAKARFKAAAMAVVWGAQLGLRRKLLTLVDSHEAKVFNLEELQRIRASFQLHSENNTMDKAAFHATMKRLGFSDIPIDRMFELFDQDGDGTVDYKEFLSSLATLRESGEDALRLCFAVYDENNVGSITKPNVMKVLRTVLRGDYMSLVEKLESIFQNLDTTGDGRISYEEFKMGIFSEPVLVQAFLAPMDGIASLPVENFQSTDIERGIINPRYIYG
eukprot:CAMPEP_0203775320 /NCGR_PEP_ID=MMETSP0099_2-20121227/5994_1 /ASSEMBLY_ACC=CAM_ASM_000209 /TAXON_ID=96639 /ORGANISM=" , Strain NY0313808BC1" /LENGTH=504 /DNA_ID=CAMNT_0050673941 /DNA_START=254 /DNA_END=1768 /DNA_ORIENTATION=+